jgi:hypothetical protein
MCVVHQAFSNRVGDLEGPFARMRTELTDDKRRVEQG